VKKVSTLIFIILIANIGLISCNSDGDSQKKTEPPAFCGPFSAWGSSDYVLPYAVNQEFKVNQTNCSGYGHSDFWLYGYDFIMDIGTPVHAMRSGVVVHTWDGVADGVRSATNLLLIQHDDGTVALYSHLTNGGVLVIDGQLIIKGDLIGLSGDSGNTGGLPHLHVSLHPCKELPGLVGIPEGNCDTQPFNFSNTEANQNGLEARKKYKALPF
jgi:murein DD-endopeptidase MepM/ murein hydrolase activator NlpD